MTMTAEQLKELLGKVTQGEWMWERTRDGGSIRALTIAGTYNDIVCAEEYAGSCWLEVENESNATLIAVAPSLARRVIAAEALLKSAQALCDRWDTSDWGGSLLNTRHTVEFITELRMDAHAYREASK